MHSLMIYFSGQVGEANDLLPDIAAKAAKLKVLDALYKAFREMGNGQWASQLVKNIPEL